MDTLKGIRVVDAREIAEEEQPQSEAQTHQGVAETPWLVWKMAALRK